jgi:hypothetical protein
VHNTEVFEIRSGRSIASEAEWAHIDCRDGLPEIPVRMETQLLLELKAQERCVDLGEVSQLVLRDMGAALRIFHRAAEESPSAEDRPSRIEDCISSLGLQSCLEALSSKRAGRGCCSIDFLETWQHAKEVAESCRQLVSQQATTASPEEAYLVGLFHQLYCLPSILGWGMLASTSEAAALHGLRLAEDWSLPRCVHDYFCEIYDPAQEQRWSKIVERAHEMKSGLSADETSIA